MFAAKLDSKHILSWKKWNTDLHESSINLLIQILAIKWNEIYKNKLNWLATQLNFHCIFLCFVFALCWPLNCEPFDVAVFSWPPFLDSPFLSSSWLSCEITCPIHFNLSVRWLPFFILRKDYTESFTLFPVSFYIHTRVTLRIRMDWIEFPFNHFPFLFKSTFLDGHFAEAFSTKRSISLALRKLMCYHGISSCQWPHPLWVCDSHKTQCMTSRL